MSLFIPNINQMTAEQQENATEPWEVELAEIRRKIQNSIFQSTREELISLIQRFCVEHCAQVNLDLASYTVDFEEEVWWGAQEGEGAQTRIQGFTADARLLVVDENDKAITLDWAGIPDDKMEELCWVIEEHLGLCRIYQE